MNFYKSRLRNESNQRLMDVIICNIKEEDISLDQSPGVLKEVPIHHIQIIDRSGSMYSDIEELIENVKQTISNMKSSDYYSVIWFSGKDQFRTILKGVPVSSDPESSFKVLDSIKSVVGMTCFNQATLDSLEISNELSSLCDDVSITLFTDGFSTTNGDEAIMDKLIESISTAYPKVLAFNTIGYGNYCEEDLLRIWSSKTQYGTFTHQSKINDYFKIFDVNKEAIEELTSDGLDIEFTSKTYPIACYYSSPSFIKKFDDKLHLSHTSVKNQLIFIVNPDSQITDDITVSINGVEYKFRDIDKKLSENWIDSILYKIAYSEYSEGNMYESLSFLSMLGDKDLIDSHMKSFTKFERSNHLSFLKKSTKSTSFRHPGSAPSNYIPDPNIPCLLDLLAVICDGKSMYHSSKTKYQRIGKETSEDLNAFRSYGIPNRISDIVFNEERLNVSIRFDVSGYVELDPDKAKEVSLINQYPCSIYRTHTIVLDGNVNVSELTFDVNKFVEDYIVKNFSYAVENIISGNASSEVTINLEKIPVINRHYNSLTTKEIFKSSKDLIIAKSCLKVAKYLQSQLEPVDSKSIVSHKLTDDQLNLLNEYSVKNGIYHGLNTRVPKNDDCDFYVCKCVKFYIKGFSSTSALSPVSNIVAGKPKKSDKYMVDAYSEMKNKSYEELSTIISSLKQVIIQLSKNLSACKISKMLTGDFFNNVIPTDKDGVFTWKPSESDDLPKDDMDDTLIIKITQDREYF